MNRLEIRNVKIQDPFWSPYMDLIREKVLPYQWEVLNDRQPDAAPSHAVKNFRIAAGLEDGEFYGEVFQDSDLAKWLEAAAYSLETHPDEELEKTIDEVIELIMRAQQEDGYLNTYFTIGRKEKEWTNLYECHEMYCSGHMMEASIAYYKATGKKQLLEAMCRNARHIAAKFGDAPELCKGYPGHQEIELALVKLYEVTGELEYLQLGKYFLEERGKKPNFFEEEWRTSRNKCTFKTDTPVESPDLYYNQSHQSIYEQSSAVGHAVRAMYMYAAMADVARETKDQELFKSCKKLWNNVVQRQMYITGAIGATPKGEAFTFDYDLPNETAYAETCASIGLIFFAHRMLKMDVNSNYGDVMERALYNVVLGAMSDDGKKFYYVNPMEIWPEANLKNPERQHVKSVRQKWFGCACCPPNIARLLSSLGQYIYSYEDTSLYVHLYIGGQIETSKGNKRFKVLQESNYPWEGNVSFKIEDVPAKDNRIAFRIPGWCKEWSVQINNQAVEGDYEKGYLYLSNVTVGDQISVDFEISAERMQANPKVRADAGKVAIQRGPMVYCLEECDNGDNLSAIRIDKNDILKEELMLENGKNVVAIKTKGYRTCQKTWECDLYREYIDEEEEMELRAIPYYMWGNRSPGEMLVWVRV